MVSNAFLLAGLLLPALVAGGALFLFAARPRVAAPGLALAFALGFPAVAGGIPAFPPGDATQTLFYVALGAGLAAFFEGRRGTSVGARLPLRGLVGALVPLLLLRNPIRHWPAAESFEHVATAAALLVLLWTGADRLASRRPGATLPLVLWLVASGTSFALLVSGFALNAQLAGTLAAILGAAVVAAWLRPGLSLARGPVAVPCVLLVALLVGGVHLAELPPACGLLLVLAPLAPWLAEAGPLSGLGGRRAVLARLALALVPVALALWLAWENRPPPDPYSDYY